ncbi:PilZ domain-containing protein [Acanthopleuribacter pedis]|uniref:PilZ domain-containing protein n=1 Tax=Acanthopleuribacter pedis TaxID=442870 RepID=A0A8J7QGQ6_9BACT|nr:PilZ domain-containing protein [Acanthopleuribacter pedis]MBO1322005.1 PilZ domain-containing protein [Acanthopleuribacter pedis]
MGYIDEVYRKRVPITLFVKKKSVQTDILFFDEKNKLIRIQQDLLPGLAHGTDLDVGFALDRTWWTFRTKFALVNEKPHILVPKGIQHHERRRNLRCSFTAREQVKVTVLEGLGSGNGVFGMAVDISTGGISLTIEKAMYLANEREIPPNENLFKPGTKLAMVKINKVPGCQLMELSGIAKRVWRDGRWRLAIEFAKLSKKDYTALLRFIEPRTLEFKPVRRSKKRREEMDERRAVPRAESSATTKNSSDDASPASERTAKTAEEAPPQPTTAPQKSEEAPPASDAVNRPTLLVFGDDVLREVPFLDAPNSPFAVAVCNTPIRAVKVITEDKPALILCGTEFKGRAIVEVLEKINNMGVLKERKVVICGNDIPSKDLIKLKMMKIETVIPLPISGPGEFLSALNS